MQGDRQVITHLNQALAHQLVAINQYFLHARMYRDWGFEVLNSQAYKASIVAMRHADDLIQRILFLEGLPNLQELGKLNIGENAKEMLTSDLELVTQGCGVLREAIKVSEQVKDFVTRDMLQELLEKEETYLDDLETELGLFDQLGEQNYLQEKMGTE